MRDRELNLKSYPFGIQVGKIITFLAAAIKISQVLEIHRLHFA